MKLICQQKNVIFYHFQIGGKFLIGKKSVTKPVLCIFFKNKILIICEYTTINRACANLTETWIGSEFQLYQKPLCCICFGPNFSCATRAQIFCAPPYISAPKRVTLSLIIRSYLTYDRCQFANE